MSLGGGRLLPVEAVVVVVGDSVVVEVDEGR